MARGWESKSVEEQQAEAAETRGQWKPPLSAQDAARAREKQSLMMSRHRVLEQLEKAQNPRHREMLASALVELDARLTRLG